MTEIVGRVGWKRKNPKVELCGNCGETQFFTGRPTCKHCGLVFKPEKIEETDDKFITTNFVVGKNMRVYFIKEKIQEGILVEIPMIREKQLVE